MTVYELIRALELCDPDAEVYVGAIISTKPVWTVDVSEDDPPIVTLA